jgi:hypothetical protein
MIRRGFAGLSGCPPVENSEFQGFDLVIISLVVAISVPALLQAIEICTNDFIYATELISSLTGFLAEINQYISMFGAGQTCAQRHGISAVAAAI